MRTTTLLLLAGLLSPGFAQAMDCAAAGPAQPLRPTVLAPVSNELAVAGYYRLGAPDGVLSQGPDEAQSVDQVLLRIRIESCHNVATITPAPGVVSPDDPAAYKPRTEFDNTPWRFNMSQNGKKMTADEFSAWMQSRGVRVARGAAPTPIPAAAQAVPGPDGTNVPAQPPQEPGRPGVPTTP